MLETSQLQTLIAVAQAQSFSKAAEGLHVTQSAISQSIKNLEQKIGVGLFKRMGKKVVLTEEGEKLYKTAAEFIGRLDDVLADIKEERDGLIGRIRIGTLTGIGKSWLAFELMELMENYPGINFVTTLGFKENLIQAFKNNELDFLILPENDLPKLGERRSLGNEKVTLVFPKGGEFKIGLDLTLDDIRKIPTILFEEYDRLFYNWCKDRFGEYPRSLNTRLVINSHGNMLQAVSLGLGIAVVPCHVLERSFYQDKVECLSRNFDSNNGQFFIVYHPDALEVKRMNLVLTHLSSRLNPLEVSLEKPVHH